MQSTCCQRAYRSSSDNAGGGSFVKVVEGETMKVKEAMPPRMTSPDWWYSCSGRCGLQTLQLTGAALHTICGRSSSSKTTKINILGAYPEDTQRNMPGGPDPWYISLASRCSLCWRQDPFSHWRCWELNLGLFHAKQWLYYEASGPTMPVLSLSSSKGWCVKKHCMISEQTSGNLSVGSR